MPHTTGAIQNPSSSGQSGPGASFDEAWSNSGSAGVSANVLVVAVVSDTGDKFVICWQLLHQDHPTHQAGSLESKFSLLLSFYQKVDHTLAPVFTCKRVSSKRNDTGHAWPSVRAEMDWPY